MEETGIVREVRVGYALVAVLKKESGCEGCPGGALCKSTDADEALIEAINEIGAKEGDRVRIVFRSLSYLKGILIVYGIPALMLLIGAVIGKEYISPLFPSRDQEGISAFVGFGFFALSFIALKLFSSRIQKRQRYKPVIVNIV